MAKYSRKAKNAANHVISYDFRGHATYILRLDLYRLSIKSILHAFVYVWWVRCAMVCECMHFGFYSKRTTGPRRNHTRCDWEMHSHLSSQQHIEAYAVMDTNPLHCAKPIFESKHSLFYANDVQRMSKYNAVHSHSYSG